MEERFWAKVVKAGPDECWLWTASSGSQGYGHFKVDGKVEQAHRVAYRLANGPIPDGLDVLHSCDTPACVNARHLRTGTDLDNAIDRESRGRGGDRKGENNPKAIFTEADIRQIRQLHSDGLSARRISEYFGVSKGAIQNVVSGKHWSHII